MRETSLRGSRAVIYGVVPNTTPPAAEACQTRAAAEDETDSEDDYSTGTPSPQAIEQTLEDK